MYPIAENDGATRRMERKTRLELATPTLARWCSTTELFPQHGAENEARTRDPHLGKVVLYH